MKNTILRKWVLISVAFIAASSLVLVAASRLGNNVAANDVAGITSPAIGDTVPARDAGGLVTDGTVQEPGKSTAERDSGSSASRKSHDDEDDDDDHEDGEHEGRSGSSR